MRTLILLLLCCSTYYASKAQLPACQWVKINFGGTHDGATEIAVDRMKNVAKLKSL